MEPPVDGTSKKYQFHCNFARLPLITKEVHDILCFHEPWIQEHLPLEFLDYYVTALLWARLLYIKRCTNFKQITTKEEEYTRYFLEKVLSLPEPIHKYLMMIGNISNLQPGLELYLGDHKLPVAVIHARGGYHAMEIDTSNHVLFEEIPSLGVSGDCIMCVASMGNLTEPLFPFLPDGTEATLNMVGYFGRASPISEPLRQTLNSLSITADEFKEDIDDTRLNTGLIEYVSKTIQKLRTFNLCDITVRNMSVEGSETQLIKTWPPYVSSLGVNPPASNIFVQTWTQRAVQSQFYAHNNPKCVQESYYAGFQLFKRTVQGSYSNWCCVKGRGSSDARTVIQNWVKSLNKRRKWILKFQGYPHYLIPGNFRSQCDATRDYCGEHDLLDELSPHFFFSWS